MSDKVNLITLKAGDVVRMVDGALVKISENPGDGLWVFGTCLGDGQEDSASLPDEPMFAQDIVELVSEAK